jgi:hypothetical protein
VYENDFESGGFEGFPRPSNPRTGKFLGKFSGQTTQTTTLTLSNLPPHKYITASFDVLVARTWDGNGRGYIDTNNLANYVPDSGPDIFKVTADDRTMVHTTFASHDLEFYRLQSFPGTYPQDANRPGTGATCTDCLGAYWDLDWYWVQFPTRKPLPDSILLKDALYRVTITYTNELETTSINFRTFALDAGNYQGEVDEWWGLDSIKVEVCDEPLSPVTVCVPQIYQSISRSSATQARLIIVGEAGTQMEIQSTVDLDTWVNERVVNFIGHYNGTVSLQTAPVVVDGVTQPAAAMKTWRVKKK